MKHSESMDPRTRIIQYLSRKRKGTGTFCATAREIAKFATVNYNTARRILAQLWDADHVATHDGVDSKCRVSGKDNLRRYSWVG